MITRLLLATIVLIMFGIAGMWDYQEQANEPTQHELEYYNANK